MYHCSHLHPGSDEHLVWFTGIGNEYHCVCRECANRYPASPNTLVEAQPEALATFAGHFNCVGTVGEPEIKVRKTSLRLEAREVALPLPSDTEVIDIQPIASGGWACLTARREIVFFDETLQYVSRIASIRSDATIDEETCLRVSSRADFVAVFPASAQFGSVLDAQTGEVILPLDRGDYRPENSFFPFAFCDDGIHTLAITATDWNRLDIYNLRSGELLSSRPSTSYERSEERPPHYLDYFHAQLTVSLDNQWVADNGWIWHPVGQIRTWNLQQWVTSNPWESEDGDSLRLPVARDYYWDGPLCWVGPTTLAVWGWGSDDEWLIPAIRLFDVVTGTELRWFAGPRVRPTSAWPPKKVAPSLFFDGYLFSVSDEFGTSVWDVESGERLIQQEDFAPVQYHSATREFLSMAGSRILLAKFVE
ncbi:MAG: hypothetical protein KF777_11000 [Planctomycetaceae bacterium]|nr:hypothetical protein [Planctomycetaceae bacterium]